MRVALAIPKPLIEGSIFRKAMAVDAFRGLTWDAVERKPSVEVLHPVAASGSKGMGQHKACAKKQWQSHDRRMTGRETGNNLEPYDHLP